MSGKMMNFTAEASVTQAVGRYGSSDSAFSGNTSAVVTYQGLSCTNPQPGCGCLPFYSKKTGVAVILCQNHMAANPACKNPSYICYGCIPMLHSYRSEYYICRT